MVPTRVDIGGLDTARIGASPAIDAIKFAAIWRQAEGSDPPFLAAAVGKTS